MTGSELRAFRKEHHLTQAMLGQLLGGLSKFTICHIEADRVALSPEGILLVWVLQNGGLPAVAGKMKVVIPAR